MGLDHFFLEMPYPMILAEVSPGPLVLGAAAVQPIISAYARGGDALIFNVCPLASESYFVILFCLRRILTVRLHTDMPFFFLFFSFYLFKCC